MAIDPVWLQNIDYDAIVDRVIFDAMGMEHGVAKPSHYKVTAAGAMDISIAAGYAFVRGTDITYQGLYAVRNTAAVTKTVGAAHASQTRIDLVVLEVRDQAANGVANNDAQIRVVAGTPGGGAPAIPATALLLATLTITANKTTIVGGDIVDNRTLGGNVGQIGDIKEWSGGILPTNYEYADGGAISRSTYDEYFALVGTSHGAGNGSTTFNKPDKRGRFTLGMDNMGTGAANRVTAAAADQVAGAGGVEKVALAGNNLPAHDHPMGQHKHGPSIGGQLFVMSSGGAHNVAAGANYNISTITVETGNMTTTPNTGTNTTANTPVDLMNPYVATPYIVKVK